MKVKIFDRSNKLELEKELNKFLESVKKLIGVKFSVRINEPLTWWSALVIYE